MIDFSKPVQTRDGRKVRIYVTDGPYAEYPVVGETIDHDGMRWSCTWTLAGTFDEESPDKNCLDLVNVPEEQFVYVNVYTTLDGLRCVGCYATRKIADRFSQQGRVGCLRINLEPRFDD